MYFSAFKITYYMSTLIISCCIVVLTEKGFPLHNCNCHSCCLVGSMLQTQWWHSVPRNILEMCTKIIFIKTLPPSLNVINYDLQIWAPSVSNLATMANAYFVIVSIWVFSYHPPLHIYSQQNGLIWGSAGQSCVLTHGINLQTRLLVFFFPPARSLILMHNLMHDQNCSDTVS